VVTGLVGLPNVNNPDTLADEVSKNGKCSCTLATFSSLETTFKDLGGLSDKAKAAQAKVKAKCSSAFSLASGSMVFALVLFTTLMSII
jgi:hypothetical protein